MVLFKTMKEIQDKWKLLPAFLGAKGIVKHHLDSFDHFIEVGIKNILKANSEIRCECDPNWFLRYLDISVGEPEIEEGFNVSRPTTPHECRLRDITYGAPIRVKVEYTKGQQKVIPGPITIGKMPIMVGSKYCKLNGKSYFERMAMKECPNDPGGYFIVNGSEKVILIHEQVLFIINTWKNLILIAIFCSYQRIEFSLKMDLCVR